MRVLFLDVDGVICCSQYESYLEESKLLLISRVVEATGAAIVLSSDWRREEAARLFILAELKRHGIECIGSTPQRDKDMPLRPLEITDWLRTNGRGVSHWVAIDDRDLVEEEGGAAMRGHLVLTEFETGITPSLANQAIKLLGGPLTPGEQSARVARRKSLPPAATSSRLVAELSAEQCCSAPAFRARYASDRVGLTAVEFRKAVSSVNARIKWLCMCCPCIVSLGGAKARCAQLNNEYAPRQVQFILSAPESEYVLLGGRETTPALIVKSAAVPIAAPVETVFFSATDAQPECQPQAKAVVPSSMRPRRFFPSSKKAAPPAPAPASAAQPPASAPAPATARRSKSTRRSNSLPKSIPAASTPECNGSFTAPKRFGRRSSAPGVCAPAQATSASQSEAMASAPPRVRRTGSVTRAFRAIERRLL